MSSEKKSVSTMDKIAGFIVDKRKAFYLVFLAAVIFCVLRIEAIRTFISFNEPIAPSLFFPICLVSHH